MSPGSWACARWIIPPGQGAFSAVGMLMADVQHDTSRSSLTALGDLDHASLPVLLRLCRALHLPIADLLPRLGGPRIRETAVIADAPGAERLSHPELELRVDRVVLAADGERAEAVDTDDDVFVFVVLGSCRVIVGAVGYDLEPRDSLDIERATEIHLRSELGATILLVRGGGAGADRHTKGCIG